MRKALVDAVTSRQGVISRRQALEVVPHHILDRAVDAGALVRVFPQVYVAADLVDDDSTRVRAGALSAGGAVSHLSALRWWGMRDQMLGCDIHVTVSRGRQPRGGDGLVVHRSRNFELTPPQVVIREDVPVVRIERAVVESWPLLAPQHRRTPAIVAVRDRTTTPARLAAAMTAQRVGRSTEQAALFDLLAAGCRSELELWGLAHVFDGPGFPPSVGQHKVVLREQVCYLDRAFLRELVDVEMDGAAYHFLPGQRERDMRRDSALAALGWLVVRFSWRGLHDDPEGCRRELLEVLAVRRHQLVVA